MTLDRLSVASGLDGASVPVTRKYTPAIVIDSLSYSVAGLVVGAMVGLTGVGGGSLMTPILMLAFGQSP